MEFWTSSTLLSAWQHLRGLRRSHMRNDMLGPLMRANLSLDWGWKYIQLPKHCDFYPLVYRAMDKVQTDSNFEGYTPTSEPFKIYNGLTVIHNDTIFIAMRYKPFYVLTCSNKNYTVLSPYFHIRPKILIWGQYATNLAHFLRRNVTPIALSVASCTSCISADSGTNSYKSLIKLKSEMLVFNYNHISRFLKWSYKVCLRR
jgi:hypothetical protein